MSRGYRGSYKPKNPHKYIGDINSITYRSLWERKFMIFCDTNLAVIKWASEEITIPYYYNVDKKVHKYYVDFVMQLQESSGKIKTYLIEIKPYKQTVEPIKRKNTKKYINEVLEWEKNQSKWTEAKQYAKQKNWEFKILTEKELFK